MTYVPNFILVDYLSPEEKADRKRLTALNDWKETYDEILKCLRNRDFDICSEDEVRRHLDTAGREIIKHEFDEFEEWTDDMDFAFRVTYRIAPGTLPT